MKATRICFVLVLGATLLASFSLHAEKHSSGDATDSVAASSKTGGSGAVDDSVSDHKSAVKAPKVERAGEVVAIDGTGSVYTIQLGDEVVSEGSILQVYRRLPSERGSADYRSEAVWWEVGQLAVTALGGTTAVAVRQSPPSKPFPAELEESGAPASVVLIGDRVRATGAIGARPSPVRVTFQRADLFGLGQSELGEEGRPFFASWLDGLKGMEGPIQVEVHVQLGALGEAGGHGESSGGDRQRDYPFGPTSERPVAPPGDLYENSSVGVSVPESRDLLVVSSHEGKADTWHYVDPVQLAQRQGEVLAGALAASLRIPAEQISVRVLPSQVTVGGEEDAVPGYEADDEQVRILASSIEYVQPQIDEEENRRRLQPAPRRPRRDPGAQPAPEEPQTAPRRRRLLERPPEVTRNRAPDSPSEPDAG